MNYPSCAYLALDCGTTNTRIWLLEGGRVLSRIPVGAGVRDTAQTGSRMRLQNQIDEGVTNLLAGRDLQPSFILAAGMVTSPLGLWEVPHIQAPAGLGELAQAVERRLWRSLGIPTYLVPGIRSGPIRYDLDNVPEVDLIRGEEAEIIGALALHQWSGPLVYVHLGSHTKVIRVNAQGRIDEGLTTLTGELMLAIRTQTILAEILTDAAALQPPALLAGADWVRSLGLSRSLFLIRVLGQRKEASADQLYSVFLGVMVQGDLEAARSRHWIDPRHPVVISGLPAMQPAWDRLLGRLGVVPEFLSQEQTEAAFLTGLQHIVFSSPVYLAAPDVGEN